MGCYDDQLRRLTIYNRASLPGSLEDFHTDPASFRKLNMLTLRNVSLSGSIDSLQNLDKLTYVDLQSNFNLSGSLAAWTSLTDLRYLVFSWTRVTGDVSALKAMTNLGTLSLADTRAFGQLLQLLVLCFSFAQLVEHARPLLLPHRETVQPQPYPLDYSQQALSTPLMVCLLSRSF